VNEQPLTFSSTEKDSQRLDKFLVACLPTYSRARLQALIKEGRVTVNGQMARKGGQWIEGNATIQVLIPPPQPTTLTPEAIPLSIVFENSDVIIVDKPAGMVVHPAAGHTAGTLVHAALAHSPDLEGVGGE
jgi:23S rRNA pseudouridine1911/1915/1917 synthase